MTSDRPFCVDSMQAGAAEARAHTTPLHIVLGGSSSRDPGLRDAETWIAEDPKGRKGFYATCIVYNAPPARP